MIKKLIAILAIALLPKAAHAFSPIRYVQISTNTVTKQSGAFNVQGATVTNLSVTTTTSTWVGATTSSMTNITAQQFTAVSSTSTWLGATTSSITNITAQNFTAVASTSTSFNATVSSITSLTNQNFTSVTSTITTSFMPPVYSSITIQMAYGTLSVSSSTTSTGFVPTGLSATFTPKFATSRVKITATGTIAQAATIQKECIGSIARGTTDLSNGNGFGSIGNGGTATALMVPFAAVIIDSPNTASSVTYNVIIRTDLAADACVWNELAGSTTILIEEIR